jgi:hypothetical protein
MSVSSVALAQSQQGGTQQPPQSGSQQQAQQSSGQQSTSQQSAGQQSAGQQAQQSGNQQVSTRSYEEVETSLKEAGFEDVRTLNAAYLVSAMTKEGEQVTFVVDPPAPEAAGATAGATTGAAPADQTALRNQQQIRDDLTQAGFTNVQILDAAYLAAGTTRSGDQITMMIDPSMSGGATGSTGSSGSQPTTGQGGSATQSGQPQ